MSLEIKNYDIRFSNTIKLWCEEKLSTINQFIPLVKSKRSFHAYCIGLPRSGTHSVSYMLSRNYRSRHEPRAHNTIYHLLSYLEGTYSEKKIRRILKYHDDIIHCEMESSHYLHTVTEILVSIFPDAKFILTVRDPLTWMNSEIIQNQSTIHYPVWKLLEDYRYSRYGNRFTKADEYLENIPYTHPVSSYLSYWSDHIDKVINTIPSDRLLVLNTKKLNNQLVSIAQFLDIPLESIEPMHAHPARDKEFNIYDHVSEDYVIEIINKKCRKTIDLLSQNYDITFDTLEQKTSNFI